MTKCATLERINSNETLQDAKCFMKKSKYRQSIKGIGTGDRQ